jgi:DNA repair protein SbcD/Mre11
LRAFSPLKLVGETSVKLFPHSKYTTCPFALPVPKFAHMSDIHIGAFRQPELRALVLDAFDSAMDRCIAEKVSFIIMAGDIFDSNIPDLSSVRRAAEMMKEVIDSGIRIYAIYGSHDFSPNFSSIVDVLNGAGLFTRAEDRDTRRERMTLHFLQDPSGVKICGLSGKKLSLDIEEFAELDRAPLEQEPGFKIFVFHGGIDELKPPSLDMMPAMPASFLPSGFAYYAGGHVHYRLLKSLPGRQNIAYPGPLFATDYAELLELARGEQRGFYLVDFDRNGVKGTEFVPVKVADAKEIYCSAEGRAPVQITEELLKKAVDPSLAGKIVLLTVEGQLGSGKTSDIGFQAIRKRFADARPLIVLPNYSKLSSKELAAPPTPPRGLPIVERELFESGIAVVKTEEPTLRGEKGVAVAVELLRTLKEPKKENENKSEFEDRTAQAGLGILGLKES